MEAQPSVATFCTEFHTGRILQGMQSLTALHITPADRLPGTSSSPLIDAMCDPAAHNMKRLTLQGSRVTDADTEAILRLLRVRPGFQGVHVDHRELQVPAAARLALGMRRSSSTSACTSLQLSLIHI